MDDAIVCNMSSCIVIILLLIFSDVLQQHLAMGLLLMLDDFCAALLYSGVERAVGTSICMYMC